MPTASGSPSRIARVLSSLPLEGERLSVPQPTADLVARARAGDTEAFVTLCDACRGRLWRIAASVARGADQEDLAQEAIIRAYSSLRSYRGDAPFEAWLCRIALNLSHDYLRSAWKRRVSLSDSLPEEGAETTESAEREAERREVQRRVRQAVACLPEHQRVPIWLHYFEGFNLAEVARLEKASEATIRSRVKAGLKRLSLSLDDLLPAAEAPKHWESQVKGCGA